MSPRSVLAFTTPSKSAALMLPLAALTLMTAPFGPRISRSLPRPRVAMVIRLPVRRTVTSRRASGPVASTVKDDGD